MGGDGWDTAGYLGLSSDYTISSANGKTTVSGVEGIDVLEGFEELRFKDKEVLDPSSVDETEDKTAPVLTAVSPADNSTGVSITSNIVLNFNEDVRAGTGLIKIYKSGGVLVDQFDQSQMMVTGQSVTLDPVNNLENSTSYYIVMEEGTIVDMADNAFVGISDSTDLNFTTVTEFNVVNGSSKADRLNGTFGQDLIKGFAGNDTINGKLGMDKLLGGSGLDVFVFDTTLSPSNVDTLADFMVIEDTIRLENGIFTKLKVTGTLNSNFYRANVGGVAQDSNDYILYDTASGHISYDADGNGAGAAVIFATMVDLVGTLTRLDFVVV